MQIVLGLVFAVCLIAFLSFRLASEKQPKKDGQSLRQTTIEIGVPFSPWFRHEINAHGKPGARWGIILNSWSAGIMLLGWLAWYAAWQIEKAKASSTGKKLRWWVGTPNFGIAIWAVGTLIAVLFGVLFPLWID